MIYSISKRGVFGRITFIMVLLAMWMPSTKAEQFAIVVLPDTQNYLDHNSDTVNLGNAQIFFSQTQWISDNAANMDFDGDLDFEEIIYVSHLGDIVNTQDCAPADEHWATANDAFATLDATNIPYGIAPGNHDYDFSSNNSCEANQPTLKYNDGVTVGGVPRPGFGADRYTFPEYGPAAQQYDNSGAGADNDNNFVLFQSPGGEKFIGLNLGWSNSSTVVDPNLTVGEAATIAAEELLVLAWADGILKTYADRKAIVTSHEISGDRNSNNPCGAGPALSGSGVNFSPWGQAIWDDLKDNPNLYMMLSGHCEGENYFRMSGGAVPATEGATDNARACMNDVHVIMSNYQFFNPSTSGYLRIMRFDTDENEVNIETHSSWTGAGHNNSTIAGMNFSNSRTDFTIDYETEISPSGVVLLPDTSGSMGWGVDGNFTPSAGERRIDYAEQAASTFVDLMFTAPSSLSVTNVGLATFPDHPFVPGVASADRLIELSLFSNTVYNNLIDAIDNDLIVGGGTPMLEGLTEADTMLDSMQCKAVVLLSDGRHNVPSTVSVGDTEVNNILTALDAGSDTPTQIYAINFAGPGEGDETLLQELANQTDPDSTLGDSSQYYDATTDIDGGGSLNTGLGLTTVYQKILTQLLGLDFGLDPIDTIAFGETRSFFQSVSLHDRKVTFVVSWRPSDAPLGVIVYDASGSQISPKDPGVTVITRGSYTIFSVGVEGLKGSGRVGPSPWQVDVSHRFIDDCDSTKACDQIPRINDGAVGTNATTIPRQFYQYSSILDSQLDLKVSLGRNNYVVGSLIRMTAEVAEGRRSIKGLKEIEVLVTAPGEGLGNFYAKNQVDPSDLDKIPSQQGGEVLNPIFRKGLYLTQIAGLQFPTRLPQRRLQLYDDGTNGDAVADDGVYTNEFADTFKEGLYSFYFKASGQTRHGNSFNREDLAQRHLEVRPVAEAIGVGAVQLDGDDLKRFDFSVVPKDLLGNFAGPGHLGRIALDTEQGKFEGKVRDNLDGTYTQTLVLATDVKEDNVDIVFDIFGARKAVNLGDILRGDPPEPKMCDTNGDDTVDLIDIRAIAMNRNKPATGPDDPMDWDENGIIDVLDARGCVLSCTLPRCAVKVAQP